VRVVVAPGQGAQRPGMLTPWCDSPENTERIARWSALTGLDLLRLGTQAAAEEISDTAIAQPLLVVASLLALRTWLPTGSDVAAACAVVAGHSVGEFAAAAAAGVLTDDDAVCLVGIRGQAMARACGKPGATGMTAVLGGDRDEVLGAIVAAGAVPANVNGASQVVAAGSAEALTRLAAAPPRGARLIALPVAGAFHSPVMASAVTDLADAVAGITSRPAQVPMILNRDGVATTDPAVIMAELVSQTAAPVRWDLCQATMAQLGVTELIELAPAGTLAAIARRELPAVHLTGVNGPADLPAVAAVQS